MGAFLVQQIGEVAQVPRKHDVPLGLRDALVAEEVGGDEQDNRDYEHDEHVDEVTSTDSDWLYRGGDPEDE